MSGKYKSRQSDKSFINELEQGTFRLTDEEFTRLKRMIVERRGRDAAHVAVAPIDTAQPCSPRSRSLEISFAARVCVERNNEGRMDPERGQLESPSAGTGLETPGRQCLPIREVVRTTAGGCFLAGASSNLGGTLFLSQKLSSGREPMSVSTIGGGGNTTISSPGRSPKHPLPGIGLDDPLNSQQACPEFDSFHQGVGQISPR